MTDKEIWDLDIQTRGKIAELVADFERATGRVVFEARYDVAEIRTLGSGGEIVRLVPDVRLTHRAPGEAA